MDRNWVGLEPEVKKPTGDPRRPICDGGCRIHIGRIRTVTVVDKDSGRDWGEFNYCQEAIDEDTKRGFEVKEIF